MNAFTFPPPPPSPPSPEAEALRRDVRDVLRVAPAERKPVARAGSRTGMDADFSRKMGQRGCNADDLAFDNFKGNKR